MICTTPEYYPTRTETGILERYGAEMAELIGTSCVLIELGSGSAVKTPLLLQHLADDAVYVPIDICEPNLLQSTQRLQANVPGAAHATVVRGLHTDSRPCAQALFRPATGHLLSRFDHRQLHPGRSHAIAQACCRAGGHDGALLIGVDCKKSPDVLNAAYNDAEGYTAAFNLNLLTRMQCELGAQLDADKFEHYAYYNAALGRIEMHLVSRCTQVIRLGNESFTLAEGETIHTENSYKYTAHEFQQLARAAGWHLKTTWSDHEGLFDVHYLSLSAAEPRHLARQS